MKRILFILLLPACLSLGCKDAINSNTQPLLPPQDLRALALDQSVELSWLPSQIQDVIGYKVWVSDQYNGRYTLLGRTSGTAFTDGGALNGVAYYYAVSAYDNAGNESGLSGDLVKAIPRPEGAGVSISDYRTTPSTSGYHFAGNSIGLYSDSYTDVFFENVSGHLLLDVWTVDTEIQDMGYTANLDEIAQAPALGWSPSGSLEAVTGHTYVVYTADGNYAKMRVTAVTASTVTFEWAYQTVKNNPMLKHVRTTGRLADAHSARGGDAGR